MKFLLSSLLLCLAAVAHAASSTGERLLTIFEDVEEKSLYSRFIGDLESEKSPASPPVSINNCSLTMCL